MKRSHLLRLFAAASICISASAFAQSGCAEDINADGVVDSNDLAQLLSKWGPCETQLAWATTLEFAPNPAVVTDASFRERMSATGLPWRVRDNGTNIEMLLVPPGTYMMGASKDDSEATKEEYPAHEVTLTDAFYLSTTEITQATWEATMKVNPSSFLGATLPVNKVSFDDANTFCTAIGMRLPTEAQWEYACRGGNTSPRYGALDDIAWYMDNAGFTTHPVGQKLANPLGFVDMIGNVREWCHDWYSDYSADPVVNPVGPKSGKVRILRGGSWVISAAYCRASIRVETATLFTGSIGLRVARNP